MDEPLDARVQVAAGIFAIAVGIFAISMPLLTGVLVSVWLGLLLVVLGIARAEALKHHPSANLGVVAAELLRASVYLVVGVIILFSPPGQERLVVLLAIPLLLDGIGLLSSAARAESTPRRSALVGAALVGISILLVVSWPGNTDVLFGFLFGAGLVLVGLTVLLRALSGQRAAHRTPA